MDLIDLVRNGYEKAALPYRQTKDDSVVRQPIFNQFLGLVPEGTRILELGCGSGYPVFPKVQDKNRNYLGIDLSHAQIELAKETYPDKQECFEVGEMFDFVARCPDASFSGVLAIFAIFHLPRAKHAELFSNLKRVLRPGSPVLFTVPARGADEGFEEDWLGAKMFWSSFSVTWYEITLQDLGFELHSKVREDKNFLGDVESTWYLLFKAPKSLPDFVQASHRFW